MDIDNNFKIGRLIDAYGDLLTDKQMQICKLYYFDNLTLAEIGQVLGISRQAVNDCIEKCTKNLIDIEEKIGKIKLLENIVDRLKFLDEKYKNSNLTKDIQDIINNID